MTPSQLAVVMTSISGPNTAIRAIADGCIARGHRFLVIGDTKSPPDFSCPGIEFFSLQEQRNSGLESALACPERHYARKNIGYLLAIRDGAERILETDDDNLPYHSFWELRASVLDDVPTVTEAGWVNVYGYFSESPVWPRGLPLDAVQGPRPNLGSLPRGRVVAPIQQGLADLNPDVDAVFRLVFPLPMEPFRPGRLALAPGAWCPFNSQNTAWWPEAFPLLYLPATCSFRMTDIWRSFVAQRIAWENGWSILFHEATVHQDRNQHDLMRDFADEVPGYLNNRRIADALGALPLDPGTARISDNLRSCYEALVRLEVLDGTELPLLDAWLTDLEAVRAGGARIKLRSRTSRDDQ